jgi:nucleotidyltransferase/DNA polymerase involved in DNA repair
MLSGMNDPLFMSADWPRAILHIDADAFFASVEAALNPELRDKPVVTGRERGIVACANYQAKGRGVRRGMPIFQAQRACPDVIVLPNDYETYGLYSQRMFAIMRRYTPAVEEYSVDEAFLDIGGMRRVLRASYEDIARDIQATIARELGITVSVGLSLSKSLAKLCSKFRKPNGFTPVCGRHIHLLLRRTPLEKVWGFGVNTTNLLQKYGLRTAYDFVMRPERWVRGLLHKPGHELWRELRGESVLPIASEALPPRFSIVRSKTFAPPSSDRAFVSAALLRNAEAAFMKARRHTMRARRVGIVLRSRDFSHAGLEAGLSRATACFLDAAPLIRGLFDAVFREGCDYRATLVALGGLESDTQEQFDLFESRPALENVRRLTAAMDEANALFGRRTVCSASSLYLKDKPWNPRDEEPGRRTAGMLHGETARRRLAVPLWNITV